MSKAITKEYLLTQLRNFDSDILEEKYLQNADITTFTITKADTATEGYVATYKLQSKVGDGSFADVVDADPINIPKDFLVKSATLETVATADDPVAGYAVGDKYIDFVINVYTEGDDEGTTSDQHVYINVKDLFNPYTAGNGINLSSGEFSAVAKTNGGLGVDANGIYVDVKSNGGLIADATGLYVDFESTDIDFDTEWASV